jgi:capsular exopolysaccharide synthesis family protein
MSALVKQNNSNLLQYIDGQLVPVMPSAPSLISTMQQPQNKELTLHDILGILKRRRWSIILPILLTVGLALLYTLSTPPSYRANALVQIEREGAQIVTTGQTSRSTGVFDVDKDPFFRTRYERLKSRTLSRKVIEELSLQGTLVPKKKETLFSVAGIMKAVSLTSESKSKANKPVDYNELFQEKLLIQPIDGTHLVEVVYEGSSAEGAKAVVTSLVNNFIKMQIETKSETGEYAREVLTKQLAEARERLRGSEEALVKYANDKGILSFDDRQTRHVKNFESLDAALVTAENRRIQAESLYVQMKRVGSVSTVLTNPVITSLKATLVRLEGDYQEMLKTFKPNYPDMQRLNQQIGNARSKLNSEMANIQRSMEADYLAAKNQESRIRSELKKFNTKMHNLQDSSLDYNTLKREVETNGKLFNQLLQRLEEVNVASAASTSSISIVEPAVAPFQRYRPKPKLNIALGLLSGLLLGLGLAFLREALDQKINSSDELQRVSGLPVLGMIPRLSRSAAKKQSGMIAFKYPQSAAAEAFRVLSTNIRFMSGKEDDRVILVTSVRPEEGKSTTASNIACAYAQMGMKVLLVDADIRNSSLHTKLGISNKKGLTNYLKGEIDLVGITQPVKAVSGLYAITAGDYVSNPVSLLAHERMSYLTTQGAKIFDMVIVDAPPVLGFADSLILSSLASSTLIVAKEDGMDSAKIKTTIEQLSRVKNNVLGFLLIKSKNESAETKYYSKYQKKARMHARLAKKKLKFA